VGPVSQRERDRGEWGWAGLAAGLIPSRVNPGCPFSLFFSSSFFFYFSVFCFVCFICLKTFLFGFG
jgi:hypothetical protein